MRIDETLFWDAYKSRQDLIKYEPNSLLLFALQLRYGIEDIDSAASNFLTDSNDDKKADLIYIDFETGHAVIAQSYICKNFNKKSAPSNKATDLNTAVSWILNRPINDLPDSIKSHTVEFREALKNEEINSIHIWYVHNLPESLNVESELKTVEHTVKTSIKSQYKIGYSIEIQAIEVGIKTLEDWYKSISTPILVDEEFTIPISGGYEINCDDWKSYFTSIPAKWLHEQFNKHRTKLFSANVRDYLGSRNVDKNINNEIKNTAEKDPSHFLVYNNGITALVHEFDEKQILNEKVICFKGVSIVNGAQTTGAIGNLITTPSEKAMVQVRFIQCNNDETLHNIVKFNNSQNKITASDFRSNDPIQQRLQLEFKKMKSIEYIPRRGGHEDIIKRKSNILPSVTASQSLAAFHGTPNIAYHKKTKIWDDDSLYSKYFNDQTTASHIFFTYTLQKAIEQKKLQLITKSKNNSLNNMETKQLDYFRKRGSTFLLTAAISNCLETILETVIPNKFRLSFNKNLPVTKAIDKWKQIVEMSCSFATPLTEGLADGFKNKISVDKSIDTFLSLIDSTKTVNKTIFDVFRNNVKIN